MYIKKLKELILLFMGEVQDGTVTYQCTLISQCVNFGTVCGMQASRHVYKQLHFTERTYNFSRYHSQHNSNGQGKGSQVEHRKKFDR